MREHWRRVFTDKTYRRRWGHKLGALTSSWWFVFVWGGDFGHTISAEIYRRELNQTRLDPIMKLCRLVGEWLLGREHWGIAYFKEETWRNRVGPKAWD
jgi:hypothetical protein